LHIFPQGSSFLATLGFEPESLWDSPRESPKGINLNPEIMIIKIKIKRQALHADPRFPKLETRYPMTDTDAVIESLFLAATTFSDHPTWL
jgi:hypothetical protein